MFLIHHEGDEHEEFNFDILKCYNNNQGLLFLVVCVHARESASVCGYVCVNVGLGWAHRGTRFDRRLENDCF